jgi:hypothetical protein
MTEVPASVLAKSQWHLSCIRTTIDTVEQHCRSCGQQGVVLPSLAVGNQEAFTPRVTRSFSLQESLNVNQIDRAFALNRATDEDGSLSLTRLSLETNVSLQRQLALPA